MNTTQPVSLKDRCEQTVVNLLGGNARIAAVKPSRQNTSEPRKSNPRIVVIAVPQNEYCTGSGLYNVNLSVELVMDLDKGQNGLTADSADQLDSLANGVYEILEQAQVAGTFGVNRKGETQTVQGLTYKRVINSTIITA